MGRYKVRLAATVFGVAMASFVLDAAAQELKNPLDGFNNAIRQIEQQQKGRPPDTVRPSNSPQADSQPPLVREAWAGLSGEIKDCLRQRHIMRTTMFLEALHRKIREIPD